MRDIIMITPADYRIDSIQQSLPTGVNSIVNTQENRLTARIPGAADPIEFIEDNSVAEFYEGEELAVLSSAGTTPNFIVVHFKDIENLKFLLASVANRTDILIDNDFGLITNGLEFIKICESTPGWDWVNR